MEEIAYAGPPYGYREGARHGAARLAAAAARNGPIPARVPRHPEIRMSGPEMGPSVIRVMAQQWRPT
eukprot:5860406-Heterocapsa_arctica.AAC.1